MLRAAELAELLERRCLRSLRPLEVAWLMEVTGLVLGWVRGITSPLAIYDALA